jgi:hypothetical protein
MKDYNNVILSNPLFLKYCVVIIVDLFKSNPDFKQKVIDSFPDLPKQSLNFNKNTSWNDSHILMFYINRNLKKFKNFLLNEYYRNNTLFSLKDFDFKYGDSIDYDKEVFLKHQINIQPILKKYSQEDFLNNEFNWNN